jgi:hypothetical protein
VSIPHDGGFMVYGLYAIDGFTGREISFARLDFF